MNNTWQQPVLFDRFPELEKHLDWVSLGDFPTPVQKLEHTGYDNLWIKQDGFSSTLYGGNKVRKLEFILGEVEKSRADHLVTFGGIGTNHGLATAIFCEKLDIGCTLLLFRQPVTRYVKTNMLLFKKYGAELIFHNSLFNTALWWYTIERIRHPRAYFLYAGGSNPAGTVGYVNAAFELQAQIEAGLLPEPTVIFCPTGSNGTFAGLSLGAKLAGLRSQVIGVRVTFSHVGPIPACTAGEVRKLMQATYRYLKKRCRNFPRIEIDTPTLMEGYLGDGYGYPTEKGRRAYQLLKDKEGILLDPTYTAKAFAAVLDYCDAGKSQNQPVLYWHTYNATDLSPQAENMDYRQLPAILHPFFEMEEIAF